MVKTTLKQLGKRSNSFYMASDLYLNIWSFWNTELQRVQVNQCQFCVVQQKKCHPSFLLGSLFSSSLDCFSTFVLTRHECVTVSIIKMFLSHFTVFYFMSCLDILEWKAFLTNLPFVKFSMIDVLNLNNCKHNAKCHSGRILICVWVTLLEFLFNLNWLQSDFSRPEFFRRVVHGEKYLAHLLLSVHWPF